MKSRLVSALVLALVAILALATIASADQGSGSGTLTAQGNGMAALRGRGSITISGSGVLYVRDEAGSPQVHITGTGHKIERNGWTVYTGFHGEARITGSNLTVALRGVNIRLQATGTGKFILRGNGTYQTGKASGVWTEEGTVVTLP
ncbi:MAG: hypothetical protein HZB51_34755 [Chloroflexi bacterium]|nr:hypothetical protein [Chloroflexota bacterium]